jgi:hypothetical protein
MEISNTPTDYKKTWYPGKKCPMCGSQEFYPLIADTTPAPTKTRINWRYNPWYGIAALIVVAVLALLIWLLPHRSVQPQSKQMLLICSECSETFEAEVVGKPPYTCPHCEMESAYGVLYCMDDFTIYPWQMGEDSTVTYPPCPECDKIRPGIIANVEKLEEIKARRAHYEAWKRRQEEMNNERE